MDGPCLACVRPSIEFLVASDTQREEEEGEKEEGRCISFFVFLGGL